MCPKSEILSHMAEAVPTVTPAIQPEKEFKREELFTRTDRPFCLNQQVFHIVWLAIGHAFTVYYCYLEWVTGQVPRSATIFEVCYGYIGGLGITVGCHRYWTHKTFKAILPLQIILMLMQTIATQYPIHKWCLDHRVHHKYTDTDADPHNSKRGFWFSHMGWLFLPRHPECEKVLKTFPMDDLEKDPVVRFQARWYWTLTSILHFIIPVSVLYFIWEMPLLYCVANNFRRYITCLHITWSVNSVAHLWGEKPYDRNISSVENAFLSFFTMGEGWHNYHHTFPWDYKTSEFGWKINVSTMFIDFFAKIGWIYDLKTAPQNMVMDRMKRTGDGSHETPPPITTTTTTTSDQLIKNEVEDHSHHKTD